jgi:hypothetical protein
MASEGYTRYLEIKDKAKVKRISTGYAHTDYEVHENNENLSYDDLALICDRGNLCFGYRISKGGGTNRVGAIITVHTD